LIPTLTKDLLVRIVLFAINFGMINFENLSYHSPTHQPFNSPSKRRTVAGGWLLENKRGDRSDQSRIIDSPLMPGTPFFPL
jgi:hypothetical protein